MKICLRICMIKIAKAQQHNFRIKPAKLAEGPAKDVELTIFWDFLGDPKSNEYSKSETCYLKD